MESPEYYAGKAAQCRRLADAIVRDDPAVEAILALAEEFEARAEASARSATPLLSRAASWTRAALRALLRNMKAVDGLSGNGGHAPSM